MQMQSNLFDPTCNKEEQNRLLQLLEESQKRLQLIQQAANIGIFNWDIQSGLVTWTPEAECLFGLPKGSFGGDFASWEQCVHPDDRQLACKLVWESIARKTNLDLQFRVIWPADQSVHWIYAKAQTFYDAEDTPLHMLGINIDITDRKNYEEDLYLKNEKLRLFTEADIIGLALADIHGSVLHANRAFLQMTGYSLKDIEEGRLAWQEFAPPDTLDGQYMPEHTQNKPLPLFYEKQYQHPNGSLLDLFIGCLQLEQPEEQLVAFVLDMTERKRLERQKDDFIGVVSHELRTPVTSIKVFAQVLQKRFKAAGDEQNAELLAKMGTQINKLARLIEDLIDVTRTEAGQLQLHQTDFVLQPLVEEVIEEMQRTTRQHTILQEGELAVTIVGDRERVGQVLTNLLSNAIKYSPHSTTVLVKGKVEEHQVRVSVQDFGLGIPLNKQDHIFQRFYRAEEEAFETIPGMGLGLYIAAQMIERQGGTMGFTSEPGMGSTFFFTLPLARERE